MIYPNQQKTTTLPIAISVNMWYKKAYLVHRCEKAALYITEE